MAKLIGTSSADVLAGVMLEMNEIFGLEGGDTVMGGWRGDVLDGGEGDDFVWGDGGNDTIEGGAGYDVLFGSSGNDVIGGGADSDYISGGKGDDTVDTGWGDDVVNANSGDDHVMGGEGYDYLFGTQGNDTLDGGAGDDYLDGGTGDDTLMVSSGGDSYLGGKGFDTLDLTNAGGPVSVDLSKKTMTFFDNTGEYISSIEGVERVVAGDMGVRAMGSSTDNEFVGGAADDWFRGKGGADTYTGGEGRDTFAWLKKDVTDGMGVDVVTDFEIGQDVMDLADFVKGGQAYEDVVRIVEGADGALVQGRAKGVWTDIAVLEGHDATQMSIADLGLGGLFPAQDSGPGQLPSDDFGMVL